MRNFLALEVARHLSANRLEEGPIVFVEFPVNTQQQGAYCAVFMTQWEGDVRGSNSASGLSTFLDQDFAGSHGAFTQITPPRHAELRPVS